MARKSKKNHRTTVVAPSCPSQALGDGSYISELRPCSNGSDEQGGFLWAVWESSRRLETPTPLNPKST